MILVTPPGPKLTGCAADLNGSSLNLQMLASSQGGDLGCTTGGWPAEARSSLGFHALASLVERPPPLRIGQRAGEAGLRVSYALSMAARSSDGGQVTRGHARAGPERQVVHGRQVRWIDHRQAESSRRASERHDFVLARASGNKGARSAPALLCEVHRRDSIVQRLRPRHLVLSQSIHRTFTS